MILQNDLVKIKYRLQKLSDIEDNQNSVAYIYDMYNEITSLNLDIEDFIIIDSIFVDKEHRSKGLGSIYLKKFCEDNKDKIIVLLSGAHTDEYTTEPTANEYMKILKRLSKFYKTNGFVNVNTYIGNYEFKETFMYRNKISEPILKDIVIKTREFF